MINKLRDYTTYMALVDSSNILLKRLYPVEIKFSNQIKNPFLTSSSPSSLTTLEETTSVEISSISSF